MSVFERIVDRRSALLYCLSTSYDIGIKLITFIRYIPEFESLNEQDRFTLFKYNSVLVFFLRLSLNYDIKRDLIIDSEVDSEEYAIACNQMSCNSYGEQLFSQLKQSLRSLKLIADCDPIILQLLMIIFVFVKGASTEHMIPNEELILTNIKQVCEAESIYTSLLFRYLMQKHANYSQAIRQYSQLIHKIIQMQILVEIHQKFLQEHLINTKDDELNPVMKSILRLS